MLYEGDMPKTPIATQRTFNLKIQVFILKFDWIILSSKTPCLLLWNQTRLQWIGNKKSENQAQQLREPKLSWNATYESLLGSNKPFRRPIPLPEMVDFLVDIWEQDGKSAVVVMMAALGRLGLKNVEQRVVCPWTTSSSCSLGRAMQKQRWGASDLMMRMLCTTNTTSTSSASASASAAGAGAGGTDTGTGVDVKKSSSSSSSSEREVGREVSLSDREGRKKFKLFPKKQRRKGLWRNTSDHGDFVPALYEFFPPGLGDALLQATQNINKLFQNLTPSGLIGRVKEHDECYKLRFNLPGLGKEALKITVEDDVLTIKGEHKEEVEEGSDDEQYLSARSFGYFIDTCIVLPEDAKVDEIKAQMKDGVLTFIIPRIEKPKKEVKEVPIH
ncbi:hypothetical protein TEA_025225 [Camellia sinensis var. sinensis]|uniref:SHSP domain-containing protein n=2 Tax=Camellia sinensis TaxID=4442 RepID=A0A4S4EZY4_CAMSN|nr:hypothetical protein TEA_025225 [Camellia sinensis var. sinensis]